MQPGSVGCARGVPYDFARRYHQSKSVPRPYSSLVTRPRLVDSTLLKPNARPDRTTIYTLIVEDLSTVVPVTHSRSTR
ncbi:MAG: hypothetical protein R3B47_19150 [Bacteroidia bacterium]